MMRMIQWKRKMKKSEGQLHTSNNDHQTTTTTALPEPLVPTTMFSNNDSSNNHCLENYCNSITWWWGYCLVEDKDGEDKEKESQHQRILLTLMLQQGRQEQQCQTKNVKQQHCAFQWEPFAPSRSSDNQSEQVYTKVSYCTCFIVGS